MVARTYYFAVLLFCLLGMPHVAHAFGRHAPAVYGPITSDATGLFKIAGDVPSDQKDLLASDLRFLQSFDFFVQDGAMNQAMHLEHADGNSMSQWLAERVQYFVGEEMHLADNAAFVDTSFVYPNASELPPEVSPHQAGSKTDSLFSWLDSSSKHVGMTNIGSSLYLVGKMAAKLESLKIPGGETVMLTSPRTGIVQIGAALFSAPIPNSDASDNNELLQTAGNRIFRLGMFFHEARHSDGNGESATFPHSICPAAHAYAGLPACDRAANGAYMVEALVTRAMSANCKECSVGESEMLKVATLDFFSRVVPGADSTPAKILDDSPEGVRQ